MQKNVKEDEAVAGKVNHFLTPRFMMEDLKEIPRSEVLFRSNLLEDLPQTEVSLKKILE